MSTEQVRMSQLQIQFCFAVAMGDEKKASELLSQINLLPPVTLAKETKQGFSYCPAIFSLWAAGQNDPHTVYRFLAQAFPREAALNRPIGVTPTKEEIANMVKTFIFEPVKKDLIPFLFNIFQLDGRHDTDLDRFYLTTSFAALDLILKDDYFSDAPAQQLQLVQKLQQKLHPIVLMAKFDDFLNGIARVEESKDTPQAVRTLIASFRNASADRSYLPSGSHTIRNHCKSEQEDDVKHIRAPRCILVN